MGNVVQLPRPSRLRPVDAVGIDFDFGAWRLVFYREGKFAFRQGDYLSPEQADVDATAIAVERGLRNIGPDRGGQVFISPSEHDGGSWSIWHEMQDPHRLREVGNFFGIGEAMLAAGAFARAHDAEVVE